MRNVPTAPEIPQVAIGTQRASSFCIRSNCRISQLQTEAGGFSMVAAECHQRCVFMGEGLALQSSAQLIKISHQQISRFGQLNGQCCVQNIRRCHARMNVRHLHRDIFRQIGFVEGDASCFRFAFDLVNSVDIKLTFFPDLLRG